jgi:hypothetical protein
LEQIAELELVIANAVEDLVALLGAAGVDKADEIFDTMEKEESPNVPDGAEGGGGGSSLSARAPEGFRIRPGEVGKACWDLLIEIAVDKAANIGADAETLARERRSGEHRHRGDFEVLRQRRSNRVIQEDEEHAQEIEAKAKFEVDAMESAISALRAGILAHSELVREVQDIEKEAKEDRVKLDGVVQTVLRKYKIYVQRYWNGAVGYRLFTLL